MSKFCGRVHYGLLLGRVHLLQCHTASWCVIKSKERQSLRFSAIIPRASYGGSPEHGVSWHS